MFQYMTTELFSKISNQKSQIAIVGLGYVGLPLAVELDKCFKVIGFDIDTNKIKELKNNIDRTNEIEKKELTNANITFSSDPKVLQKASIIIVTVPTPIDTAKQPNLNPVKSATKSCANSFSESTKKILWNMFFSQDLVFFTLFPKIFLSIFKAFQTIYCKSELN